MQRVSIRTLVLLVELLVFVAAHQYLSGALPARAEAGAVWLAGDIDELEDANEPLQPVPATP